MMSENKKMKIARPKPKLNAFGKVPTAHSTALHSLAERNARLEREMLMEKIRARNAGQKNFVELSKNYRLTLLDRRYLNDAVERANLQKALDCMEYTVKQAIRQPLVERLEDLSRTLGMKFMQSESNLFISTDMFFLEIVLENNLLKDVKVHHECKVEQQSCSELVSCLKRGDYKDFTVQLEGLISIYQLNAEPKVKAKAFLALTAMETDIYSLFQMNNYYKDLVQAVIESKVGLVIPRRGGHPLKVSFFLTPYNLMFAQKVINQLSPEQISSNDFGYTCTLHLEAFSSNKLQIAPTVTSIKDSQTGLDVPVYAPLTQLNSTLLPAHYVFNLNQPLPVCYSTFCSLGLGPGISTADAASTIEAQSKQKEASEVMRLIVSTASDDQLKFGSKGLFVCLPDQTHCYFLNENKSLKSSLVSVVQFTEISQVPTIFEFLKRHALFYTLLSSCVRPQSKMGNDMDTTIMLEVFALSFSKILVSLQHTYDESMITVEFCLEGGTVNCCVYSHSQIFDLHSQHLTKIAQKCCSIPVTIRELHKAWDRERTKIYQRNIGTTGAATQGMPSGYGNFNLVMSPNDPGGRAIHSSLNLELSAAQSSLAAVTNATVGDFFNFKNEVVQAGEDFHESPKSQTLLPKLQSVEECSLGHSQELAQQQQDVQQQQQQPLLQPEPSPTPMLLHQPQSQPPEEESLPAPYPPQTTSQHQQSSEVEQAPTPPQLLSETQLPIRAADIEIADKYTAIWKDKTPNLKNCVSITPIQTDAKAIQAQSAQGPQQSFDVQRSGAIEIIPLTAQSPASVGSAGSGSLTATNSPSPAPTSSTITITPINSSSSASVANSTSSKEKKPSNGSSSALPSSSSSSAVTASSKRTHDVAMRNSGENSDSQREKKRKKKRDDSPMGPPEKVYSRQNSPATTSDATTTAVARKFSSPSSSPKGASGGALFATSTGGNSTSLPPTRPSPKHSPVYSSPKHSTASNSPKSPFGTHSPKHGSSGKPSMSTLKNAAATSLSPKGDKSSNSGSSASSLSGMASAAATTAALARSLAGTGVSTSSASAASSTTAGNGAGIPAVSATAGAPSMGSVKVRDKDKPTSILVGVGSSPCGTGVSSSSAMSSSAKPASSVSGMLQMKSVPGLGHLAGSSSLSGLIGSGAVSSAMEQSSGASAMRKSVTGAVSLMSSVTSGTAATKQPSSSESSSGLSSQSQSTEYQVKSSQEGLKLTINKTSNKSSSSSSSSSSNSASSKVKNSSSGGSSSSGSSTSVKKHTGLKPGVNSGPASKKSPSTLQSSNSSSSAAAALLSGSAAASSTANSPSSLSGKSSQQSTKHLFQKSNSSGNLTAKLSSSSSVSAGSGASSSGSTLFSTGLTKSNSATSFSDMALQRKSNNSSSGSSSKKLSERSDRERASLGLGGVTSTTSSPPVPQHQMDMLKILQQTSPIMASSMEGQMKGINPKFQIPKLSQRVAPATATATPTITTTAPAAAVTIPAQTSNPPISNIVSSPLPSPSSLSAGPCSVATTTSMTTKPTTALSQQQSFVAGNAGIAGGASVTGDATPPHQTPTPQQPQQQPPNKAIERKSPSSIAHTSPPTAATQEGVCCMPPTSVTHTLTSTPSATPPLHLLQSPMSSPLLTGPNSNSGPGSSGNGGGNGGGGNGGSNGGAVSIPAGITSLGPGSGSNSGGGNSNGNGPAADIGTGASSATVGTVSAAIGSGDPSPSQDYLTSGIISSAAVDDTGLHANFAGK